MPRGRSRDTPASTARTASIVPGRPAIAASTRVARHQQAHRRDEPRPRVVVQGDENDGMEPVGTDTGATLTGLPLAATSDPSSIVPTRGIARILG